MICASTHGAPNIQGNLRKTRPKGANPGLPEVSFGHLRLLTFFPCGEVPILQDALGNNPPFLTARHFGSAVPDSERFPETPVETKKIDMFRVNSRRRLFCISV